MQTKLLATVWALQRRAFAELVRIERMLDRRTSKIDARIRERLAPSDIDGRTHIYRRLERRKLSRERRIVRVLARALEREARIRGTG